MPDFKPFVSEAPPIPDSSYYILPEGWTHVAKDVDIPIPCNLIYPNGDIASVKFPDGFYAAMKGFVGFQRIRPLGTKVRFVPKKMNRVNSPLYGKRTYWTVKDTHEGEQVANLISTEEEAIEIAGIYNRSIYPI